MSRSVLVVDDEATVRIVLRTRLTLSGYRVIEATNGQEALAALEAEMPAVMLLDLRLPDMEGWEILERLRARSQLDRLKVVVVSAYGGPAVERRARELGCQAVLQKPFSLRELVETLDALLL